MTERQERLMLLYHIIVSKIAIADGAGSKQVAYKFSQEIELEDVSYIINYLRDKNKLKVILCSNGHYLIDWSEGFEVG